MGFQLFVVGPVFLFSFDGYIKVTEGKRFLNYCSRALTPRCAALVFTSLKKWTWPSDSQRGFWCLMSQKILLPPRERACQEHLCCSTVNIKINHAFLRALPSSASAYIYFLLHDWSLWEVGRPWCWQCCAPWSVTTGRYFSLFLQTLEEESSHMPCVELWADAVIPRLHTEPISMKSDNTVRKSTVLFSLQCLLQIKYQEQTL